MFTRSNSDSTWLREQGDPFVELKTRITLKRWCLSAIACPRYDENQVWAFGSKIGIWPFIQRTPALRNLINRPAVTLITTTNLQVTKQSYTYMIINNVIPAIWEKWSVGVNRSTKTIYIQHDNTRSTYFGRNYLPFLDTSTLDGWTLKLTGQLANSPDMNINDVSFFRALQSGQYDSVED
jgi:hypothetical protein